MNYLQALMAYLLWGIFPLYWKLLPNVNSFEIICHRIVWSLLTLVLCVGLMRQWPDIKSVLKEPRRIALCCIAALLISSNWFIFIWAVQHGYTLEASLGYFINPMFNVVVGVCFFREKLHPLQWLAVGIAVLGLFVMTYASSQFPMLAVALAGTFSLYAAVKKMTVMPAIAGLGMETAILAPVAIIALCSFSINAHPQEDRGVRDWLLLLLGGPVTTLPLVLFAAAAKSVPMVAMGMLQYIAPTMQFLIGVSLFGEKLDSGRVMGFGLVWAALLVFSFCTIYLARQRHRNNQIQHDSNKHDSP